MTDPVARSMVVGWPSGWRHPTVWLTVTLLALWLAACGGGSTEPVATAGSLGELLPPTTALAAETPPTTETLVVDPNVDAVLGIVPPEPAELLVQDSIAYLDYVAECARQAGVQVDVIATANPGLAPRGQSTPRDSEVVGRCLELPGEKGWLIPSPFDGSVEGNRLLYAIRVDIYDCLVANGYPTVEPPSKELFVEEGESAWNPYEGMVGDKLFVSPNAAGEIPPEIQRQLEAQKHCGASENEIYAQRLAQGDRS